MFSKLSTFKYWGVAFMLIFATISTQQPATAKNCHDLKFIFARGSGSNLNDQDYQAFYHAFHDATKDLGLSTHFYELGSTHISGTPYPAITIANPFHAIGAFIGAGQAYQYGESVNLGIEELTTYITKTLQSCPRTQFILGGYSQGAQVVSQALPKLNPRHILYAATFGDPKLYLPEGQGLIPDACRGINLSDYRTYVPNCHTHEGILRGLKPYQPHTSWAGKLGTWCNQDDIICSSGFSADSHRAYTEDQLYAAAAKHVLPKITQHFHLHTPTQQPTLDTAILIDSTGSMEFMIENYKNEAIRLADITLKRNGRVALLTYRDLIEGFTPKLLCDFHDCSLETFTQQLHQLTLDGGIDVEESALSASLFALNSLKWQPGATKSLVILTDAGFHSPDRDGTTLQAIVQRSLEIDPVNFFIITNYESAAEYRPLANGTGGRVFAGTNQLQLSTDYIVNRPEVKLAATEYLGLIDETLYFDASASTSSTPISKYEWDLDGDGIFETTTTEPIVSKTYHQSLKAFIQVRITDQNQLQSTMSAQLTILAHPPTPATIDQVSLERTSAETAHLSFTASSHTTKTLLIINDAILGFVSSSTTLTDLDPHRSTTITLIPYTDTRGTPTQITLPTIPLVPNCGVN